jgi:transcriptional regulator with XRE-family HTH domain
VRKSRHTAEYERFLDLLRAVRARKGIQQTELADRLGVPQQYISRFETGETRMDVIQLWRYCRAVGISFVAFCRYLDKDLASRLR